MNLKEAEDLLYIIIEEKKHAETDQDRVLKIITGKGKHSKQGPILFPEIQKILKEQGHQILKAGEGRIICRIN